MKKKIAVFVVCTFVSGSFAQNVFENEQQKNIDWTEDSTEITTVDDIIKIQQEVSLRNSDVNHFKKVWERRGYFNISFLNTKLEPQTEMETGLDNGIVPDFKSDWGVSLQLGRSYRLHKKPIANILQFAIDYDFIDLCVNHFKAEDGEFLYNSSNRYVTTDEDGDVSTYYYVPWNLEKYEANYAMALGPSVTVAPFTYLSCRPLHFLRLHLYYHIGYHVSFLLMKDKKSADKNQSKDEFYNTMSDNTKAEWGHGLTHSIGFGLSWKFIGIGYEHRSAKLKYKSINTKEFGKDEHEFKASTNRIYLQIRM